MEYIKLFQNHSGYSEYLASREYLRPNVSHCIQENEVHYTVPIDWIKEYFTIESLEDNNTIYLKASSTAITKTVSASTDNGSTWVEYTSSTGSNGTTLATLNTGDKLLVKGENEAYGTSSYYNQFKSTGQFEVKGNIMSLISGDSFVNADELVVQYTFYRLFYECTGLISAENLVLAATTLANNCYSSMFQNCTNLTTAPELPAEALANNCYLSMFNGCTSLTTAPELPATTLAGSCYYGMFSGCTSLTTAPELPATTLASYCYCSMFTTCTSLTTAPAELPATALTQSCYESMFSYCTSLTSAPELPATTLASYCYNFMFYSCTSLNYIKAMFTTTPGFSYTRQWIYNVASSGTFVKNAAAQWDVTSVDGIPTGWTVQTATE